MNTEHKCGKIWEEVNEAGTAITKWDSSIIREGGCNSGCCTYFRCVVCGEVITVEWPD